MSEPASIQTLRRTLRRRIGFRSLREGQEDVNWDVLAGRDTLAAIDTGMYRENLRLEAVPSPSEAARRAEVARIVRETAGTGIVYVSTVKACDELVAELAAGGLAVARYHGRLPSRERRENQERFMAGELAAMVATNAFGMGIDKPDVRFVVHAAMPGSLESYYQEAGRAGRDGKPARCVLLHRPEDRNTQVFFINGSYPRNAHFHAVHGALAKVAVDREATLAEIREAAGPVPRAKLRVVLTTLVEAGIAAEPERGRLRLARRASDAAVEALAGRYREKADADRERLKRMVAYTQTALCRWKALLAYFGEEPEWERCGRCDNCARPIEEPASMPHAEPPVARPEDIQPLPPLLGGARAGDLRPGDPIALTIYGRGEVRELAGDVLSVALDDGEIRRFRRPCGTGPVR